MKHVNIVAGTHSVTALTTFRVRADYNLDPERLEAELKHRLGASFPILNKCVTIKAVAPHPVESTLVADRFDVSFPKQAINGRTLSIDAVLEVLQDIERDIDKALQIERLRGIVNE